MAQKIIIYYCSSCTFGSVGSAQIWSKLGSHVCLWDGWRLCLQPGLTSTHLEGQVALSVSRPPGASKVIWACSSHCNGASAVCLATGLCSILCDPVDCSLPGSSVHGILQARISSGSPFPSPGDLQGKYKCTPWDSWLLRLRLKTGTTSCLAPSLGQIKFQGKTKVSVGKCTSPLLWEGLKQSWPRAWI